MTEHLDVAIVGAGLSGISAGHYIAQDVPWASYAIFEGRASMGGTWDLFRYPGIRSDSDMFTLGFSFRPWTGAKAIADGESIRTYIEETAAAESIDQHIRYRRKVAAASWSSDDAKWTLTVLDADSGSKTEVTCSFLFTCTGYYRYDRGYRPDIPGLDSFEGPVVHPQQWPDNLNYTGKRVVVIGSGATAVTLVPAMADTAAHVTMLQRSPTYIASVPSKNPIAELGRIAGDRPAAHSAVRWTLAVASVAMYTFSRRYPDRARRMIRRAQERELPADFDFDTHLTPSYQPWDQRMCAIPDGDLFAAIRSGSASIVTDHIQSVTADGIELRSGEFLPADLIVTATGLEMLFLGGIALTVDSEAVDPADRLTYRGAMLEGVPNLAFAVGYTNASWTLKAELSCRYVTALLTRLRETGFRQATPRLDDADTAAEPLLPLTSGYIQRAAGQLPRQGSAFPWQVHQNYLRDYRAMRANGVEDAAMHLTNRRPALQGPRNEHAGTPAAAGSRA